MSFHYSIHHGSEDNHVYNEFSPKDLKKHDLHHDDIEDPSELKGKQLHSYNHLMHDKYASKVLPNNNKGLQPKTKELYTSAVKAHKEASSAHKKAITSNNQLHSKDAHAATKRANELTKKADKHFKKEDPMHDVEAHYDDMEHGRHSSSMYGDGNHFHSGMEGQGDDGRHKAASWNKRDAHQALSLHHADAINDNEDLPNDVKKAHTAAQSAHKEAHKAWSDSNHPDRYNLAKKAFDATTKANDLHDRHENPSLLPPAGHDSHEDYHQHHITNHMQDAQKHHLILKGIQAAGGQGTERLKKMKVTQGHLQSHSDALKMHQDGHPDAAQNTHDLAKKLGHK